MPTVKEALKTLVGIQKASFDKELKVIERMRKVEEAARAESIRTKEAKGSPSR